ncbi:glycosyltransferase [Christiangramia sp. OXR-203]|jgi:glycosyltransferase involved in cell wall biosynthesis|uniref:glycosyltransferase n=1 Tax=Christiangramia sp. OXR-203 TaxID=3100176 RepID=UPI002AC9C96F|nr:glycosyltransferase [Christiangramia sp. OXR-203]WPY99729.1 glycosyltransferase [Christiangramia sp. OXR-203]
MRKIKVLHIIKSLGRGGAEMLLPETLRLHNKEKFEFDYVYFLPWKNQMVKEISEQGGKVICIEANNNLSLLSKYNEVAKYCKKNNIDIIHSHLPWSGFLSRLVYKQTGIPLIYTEHNIQERYHVATKKLNAFTFNWQSKAIGVSADVSKSISENINPDISVQTLLNGVNTQKFFRDEKAANNIKRKYKIPKNALVVGNLAVFREQKDLVSWVKAFKVINESMPAVYALIVGAGPKQSEIQELIKALDLEGKIILPGLQTNTVAYLSAMDIFMMSSQFEGLPIALLEAMSIGCAIVSTKAGGVVEVIEHNKNGLLSEVGDSKMLAENCTKILNNTSLRKMLQAAARERVVDAFSLENMVDELERCYMELAPKN